MSKKSKGVAAPKINHYQAICDAGDALQRALVEFMDEIHWQGTEEHLSPGDERFYKLSSKISCALYPVLKDAEHWAKRHGF